MSERNNVSGLSFIPSGWRDPGGTYGQLYSYSTLWSSSLVSYPYVFAFRFFRSDEVLDFYNEYLSFALSVRCIK